MKTWRVLALVSTVLGLGQFAACGDGGGKSDEEDTGGPAVVEDADVDDVDADVEEGVDPKPDAKVDAATPAPEMDSSTEIDAGAEACVPKGCSEFGYECGEASDGCGGKLPDCGKCKAPETCGAITPNMCDCKPKTCQELTASAGTLVCGTAADGCGGTVECGGDEVCGANKTCGGGGEANRCGCTPNLAACSGKECGTASDGCGGTLACGTSAGMCSENKECNAQQACVCKADASAVCTGKCGPQQTADGCTFNCTACIQDCPAGGGAACGVTCTCPAGPAAGTADDEVCLNGQCCVPNSILTTCGTAQCGTRVNNCGQTIVCGTCGDGLTCSSEAKCDTPAAAALIGKYAVRSGGFANAIAVARAEGLLLVDIARDSTGKLMMREQQCWSAAYLQSGDHPIPSSRTPVTEMSAASSANLRPTSIELDLTQSQNLPGAKEWVRGVQPSDQNVGGWRRGRPSYCPADGSAPSPSLPGFEPANDVHGIGAKKPWLPGDHICLCPAQEMAKRNITVCSGQTGTALTTCVDNWAQNSLPYQPGAKTTLDTDVTDCRVVDEELDGKPGTTGTIKIPGASATVKSASVTANVFWGKIDFSASKSHWGVSQDQPALRSSAVSCGDVGGFGTLICNTSTGGLCPAYKPAPATADKANRLGPVDFVSLHQFPTPAGGWTCQAIVNQRASIFNKDLAPETDWRTKYPSATLCPVPQ